MPDEPFKVSGFDESSPSQLPKLDDAHVAEENLAKERREALVDKRLHALKTHIEHLHGRVGAVDAKVTEVDSKVTTLTSKQSVNNDMTEKILAAVQGGKFLIGAIKFFGALAVPIAAIWTLWYTWTHGGPPPPLK